MINLNKIIDIDLDLLFCIIRVYIKLPACKEELDKTKEF